MIDEMKRARREKRKREAFLARPPLLRSREIQRAQERADIAAAELARVEVDLESDDPRAVEMAGFYIATARLDAQKSREAVARLREWEARA